MASVGTKEFAKEVHKESVEAGWEMSRLLNAVRAGVATDDDLRSLILLANSLTGLANKVKNDALYRLCAPKGN